MYTICKYQVYKEENYNNLLAYLPTVIAIVILKYLFSNLFSVYAFG